MDPVSLTERVAVIEDRQRLNSAMLGEIDGKLDRVMAEMTRYKGMVGGISLIVSLLVAALSLTKDWLLTSSARALIVARWLERSPRRGEAAEG